jgi:hypothetical protein
MTIDQGDGGYESWQGAASDGTQTIAQVGGNLVVWK